MKRKIIYQVFTLPLSIFIGMKSHGAYAQNISEDALMGIGFENIRVYNSPDRLLISAEDNIYRWNVNGIDVLLDSLFKANSNKDISLFIVKEDIPQVQINISSDLVQNIDSINSNRFLDVKYVEDSKWRLLRDEKSNNSSFMKMDLVFYPQLYIQNVTLSRIYEVQFNIAPALELVLWRGMKFTGQVIFPAYVDPIYREDNIRPGFITLSQSFRLPKNWYTKIVVGNFNSNRYGTDLTINKPLSNRWNMRLNAGLTGFSMFYEGDWINTPMQQLTWNFRMQHYYPKYNLQVDLSYGQYLNNDRGGRVDLTRHFGETTVGFYAMYTGENPNGGFRVNIALPSAKRRNRNKALRLMLPRYFDWIYNAGTESYYGQYYQTRENENMIEHWYNPINILNNENNKYN